MDFVINVILEIIKVLPSNLERFEKIEKEKQYRKANALLTILLFDSDKISFYLLYNPLIFKEILTLIFEKLS